MGKSTISMAIFNCYVSSPEGRPLEFGWMILPSGYVKIAIENHHRNSGYFPIFIAYGGDFPVRYFKT